MPASLLPKAFQEWFCQEFGKPTPLQLAAWKLLLKPHASGLIAAPTGAGKTMAAFVPSLVHLVQAPPSSPGIKILYISPLKALSNDIEKTLLGPLAAFNQLHSGPAVRIALRTGDTTAYQRAQILKKPPEILVTTPESLYLLLTSPKGRDLLRGLQTVIVDEIHAFAGDKRGAHLALSLARLEHLQNASPLSKIGLSATARPLEAFAALLGGQSPVPIVDFSSARPSTIQIRTPDLPLGAFAGHAVWQSITAQLVEAINTHQSTLIFVNTRRMAERLTRHLEEALASPDMVATHHGSLAKERRLAAEQRLKQGDLKALVATASLELGIDIGAIDLVCQIAVPYSVATFLQRVGRSGHAWHKRSKALLFPLTRDELIDAMAMVHAAHEAAIDAIEIPDGPLDILAQQIVAMVATEDWSTGPLYQLIKTAYPYRDLTEQDFNAVIELLSRGFAPHSKRGLYLHHDPLEGSVKARRHARLCALSSGGAIPEQYLYRVVIEDEGTVIGTVDEEFAVESSRGDIFQLGNHSWRIMGLKRSQLLVKDAGDTHPSIPFWQGEAPGRSFEFSGRIAQLRVALAEAKIDESSTAQAMATYGLLAKDWFQALDYIKAQKAAMGVIPDQAHIVWERFFDEIGGMQLVIHAPFGRRINRAWGLALRKRFCRSYDFELQAAADDNALMLSIGPNQGFQIEDLFGLLKSAEAHAILVQALLAAPLFQVRWRWNVTRSLAVLRFHNGKAVLPHLQRFQSEDLLTAVFPDQTQCFEHRTGDLEVPKHPIVEQTVKDCLEEAMDHRRWLMILKQIEAGEIRFSALDSREPSPFCYGIIHANTFSFLDDAPLEDRRTRALKLRPPQTALEDIKALGALDPAAIEQVKAEARPLVRDPEELGSLLEDLIYCDPLDLDARAQSFVAPLVDQGRLKLDAQSRLYLTHRAELMQQVDEAEPEALYEVLRGHLSVLGPVSLDCLAQRLKLPLGLLESLLKALEAEGFVLSGYYQGGTLRLYCERRLLQRIHRLSIRGRGQRVPTLSPHQFIDFLCTHQALKPGLRRRGYEGLVKTLEQLAGLSLPASLWEGEILPARVRQYQSGLLDQALMSGSFVWGHHLKKSSKKGSPETAKLKGKRSWHKAFKLSLSPRESLGLFHDSQAWLEQREAFQDEPLCQFLEQMGPSFLQELAQKAHLPPAQCFERLGTLVLAGLVSTDHWMGLRSFGTSLEWPAGGRYSLFPPGITGEAGATSLSFKDEDKHIEAWAWLLLRRWGILFYELWQLEPLAPPWRPLLKYLRRLEARGQIIGGRFVTGVAGEQYALTEAAQAIADVASHKPSQAEPLLVISAFDPLHLHGLITQEARIPARLKTRLLLRGGQIMAVQEGGQYRALQSPPPGEAELWQRLLRLSGSYRYRDPFSAGTGPSASIESSEDAQTGLD